MRFVFACLPAYGHLQPMVPLASACVAAGHEVLVATGPDMVDRARRLGLGAAAVGPTRDEGTELTHRGPAADGSERPLHRVWDNYTYIHRLTTVAARRRAADLVPLVAEWRPDVVVHDVADFAAPMAAATIGVPSALHSWGPPLPERLMLRAGAKTAPLWTDYGLPASPTGGMQRGTYIDLCPPSLRPDDIGDIPRVQPLRPAAGTEPWMTLPDELSRLPYPTTVHVTLGTVSNSSLDTFRTILAAVVDLPLNVVMTLGPDQDPGALGEQPANVYVAAYVPIDLLLARCDAVIAHGGSGTMLAALRHGLPQVIIPYDADNVRNARLCETAGVAVQVPLRELDEDGVRAGLERVLADDGIRAAARGLAAEIDAMPAPADVVRSLEEQLADQDG